MATSELQKQEFDIKYDGPVLDAFFHNKKKPRKPYEVAIIRGPVGSGKTRVALYKLFMAAASMQKMPVQRGVKTHFIRQSRWVIIKDTTPSLKTTVIPDFLDLFPETTKDNPNGWGTINMTPPITYSMRKNGIEAEFIFLALDDESQIKKLKSMNLTGGYVNEGQYCMLSIFTALGERSARYPNKDICSKSNPMVIMDMNAAEAGHWMPVMMGETPVPDYFTPDMIRQHKKPDWWDYFVQPPALIEVFDSAGMVVDYKENTKENNQNGPWAENMMFLPEEYYLSKVAGQPKEVIDTTCMNRTGVLRSGKPVFPGWNKQFHVAKENLEYRPELPLIVGLDFGRTPAAVWAQYYNGRWFVLGDYYLEDVGFELFAPMLQKEISRRIPNIDWENIRWWGDPAGDFRGQNDESTPFLIWRKLGINIQPAKAGLRVSPRIEAVSSLLARVVGGYAGLLVDPSCNMLIGGFDGGYRWRTIRGSMGQIVTDEVDKSSRYSHNMDAFMYLLAGAGEVRLLLNGNGERPKPIQTRVKSNQFRTGSYSFGRR